jgi:hypothetical protein
LERHLVVGWLIPQVAVRRRIDEDRGCFSMETLPLPHDSERASGEHAPEEGNEKEEGKILPEQQPPSQERGRGGGGGNGGSEPWSPTLLEIDGIVERQQRDWILVPLALALGD